MSKSLAIHLMLAVAALGLALSGCETKPETQQAEETAVAQEIRIELKGVSDAERAEAAKQVRQVRAEVKPAGAGEFARDLAVLTRFDHRLAGYGSASSDEGKTVAGSIAAANYVADRLKSMPIDWVFTQDFPLVQPVTTECRMFIDGQEVSAAQTQQAPIYAAEPNFLHASVTPAEGLEGQTIYVGNGEVPEYGNSLAQDKIVLVDFDCNENWLDAFALGAKAVVFIGSDTPARHTYHHVNMPANLPRFYISSEVAESLELKDRPRKMKIMAACKWETLHGRNVIAVIPGTNPRFSDADNALDEAIVLAAPLDSLSEVPLLSPGARDAANVASLLQIAEYFAKRPPRRTILVCFFDGQTLNHLGARAFYGSLYRRLGKQNLATYTLEEQLAMLQAERDFRNAAIGIMEEPEPFAKDVSSRDYHAETVRLLRSEANYFSGEALEELTPLRIELANLKASVDGRPDARLDVLEGHLQRQQAALAEARAQDDNDRSDYIAAQIARLTRMKELAPRIAALTKTDLGWNRVLKYLHDKETIDSLEAEASKRKLPGSRRDELDKLGDLRKDLVYLRERTIELQRTRLAEIAAEAKRLKYSAVLREAIGPAKNSIVLHVSVNLGDARSGWMFIHGDDSLPLYNDVQAHYTQLFKAMRSLAGTLGKKVADFDTRPIQQTYAPSLFTPGRYADSGAIARLFAIFNGSVMTVLDRTPRQGQPADTIGALNVEVMQRRVPQVRALLAAMADDDRLSQSPRIRPAARYAQSRWTRRKREGSSIRRTAAGGSMEKLPVRGATVAIAPTGNPPFAPGDVSQVPPGFRFPIILKTDVLGQYEFGPYCNARFGRSFIFAATFDNEPAASASDRQPASRGIVEAVSTQKTALSRGMGQVTEVFKARCVTPVSYGFDRGSLPTIAMRASSSARFQPDFHLLCEHKNVLSLYAARSAKGMKLFNQNAMVILNNRNTRKDYQGMGEPLTSPFVHPFTSMITAHDFRVLNEYRMDLLRANRISQESLAVLDGQARDIEEDAAKNLKAAQSSESLDKLVGDLAASSAYSRRVYGPLVGVMNDLVSAVVLLLLLAIPFAYAMERLLIGSPHIYRQIGYFAVFFLLTFALLFMVNPAFKIAATPVIIFLAFAIILLSCLVIFIMVRKLQTEVHKMQGLAATVHSADVSRLSTMTAAINMGISTMRRRPLRTFLTAATVVLLTFTILTFASFGNSWGTRQTYEGPMSSPGDRILVRDQLWGPISEPTCNTLRGHLGQDAEIVRRYWVSPTSQETQVAEANNLDLNKLLTSDDLSVISPVAAAIGIDTFDLDHQANLREQFAGDLSLLEGDGIFLTGAMAKSLGLTDDDIGKRKVLLAGRELTYAGLILDKTARFEMLDGSSMLPVDYQATGGGTLQGMQQQAAAGGMEEIPGMESAQFSRYSLDQVVVVSERTARDMGGQIRSVTIYPESGQVAADLARRVATIARYPVYYAKGGGVYRLIFTALATASGVKDLLIPVLLGGLIVFATMLGSVSDREREIYTFSSLGLAPPHIASLFFAEAAMYAVIGGMGGYLLGQVVARVLGYLGTVWNFSIPSMNYSSTNAIVTIMIVMGTVLISTIYPAMKASRSANPGIQRSWKIPKPEGNLYDLMFPFTVSAYDIIGVVSFLKEHFDNFTDTSIGAFACSDNRIFRQADTDLLGFGGTVALAPFDLGVSQRFALLSQPSDIEGIDEVRVLLYRLSGAQGDWQRANRVFVNDMRKQLLIWRSLPEDVMERYRSKTLETWDSLPREQVTPQSIGGQA